MAAANYYRDRVCLNVLCGSKPTRGHLRCGGRPCWWKKVYQNYPDVGLAR